MKMVARLKVEDEKKKGRMAPFWLGFEGSVGGKKKFKRGEEGRPPVGEKKSRSGAGGSFFFVRERKEFSFFRVFPFVLPLKITKMTPLPKNQFSMVFIGKLLIGFSN